MFGQIKQARGFRQFLLRGIEKVKAEWALIASPKTSPSSPERPEPAIVQPTALCRSYLDRLLAQDITVEGAGRRNEARAEKSRPEAACLKFLSCPYLY